MSPAMCRSRTKTCPCRAATIPGAGKERRKRSQLAARFSSGTMRPNTRIAAPHPQNDRGHPAGRPPTILAADGSELVTEIRRLRAPYRCRCCAGPTNPCVCASEDEKSQGILTLHSGGGATLRGRASKEMEVANTKADAITIRSNMQDSGFNSPAPDAESTLHFVKIRSLNFDLIASASLLIRCIVTLRSCSDHFSLSTLAKSASCDSLTRKL